jgi:transposase
VYGAYTLRRKFHYKFVEKQLAIKTRAFLERLRKAYKKIVFLLDRARWHTAKIIRAYARKHKADIKLVFFPITSPDLNPVEECWRQTRNEVTANTAFSSIDRLKAELRRHWNAQKFQHSIINYLCS